MMRERVDGLAGNQDVELHHGRFPVAGEVIVERGVSARDGFQAIVEVEHDFVEGQLVVQHDARAADVLEIFLLAALFFDQLQNSADIFLVGEDRGEDDRLFDFGDFARIGPARRIVDFDDLAVGRGDFVADAGRGGDEVEVVFALETLLNDLHVQQAEEAAAEAEAESGGAFRLEEE